MNPPVLLPEPTPGGEFRGTPRFDLISRLGAGGMGEVYRAYDRERDTIVALKVLRQLNADTLLRFKNEFRRLQDVQHPNLVTLGELFSEAGHWFFSMELVDGFDFLTWCCPSQSPLRDERGLLDEARLRQALAQLAMGLLALHDRKVVHRDIKPSNVLCDVHGLVKIVDFGLSHDMRTAPSTSDLQVVGSVAYMAPEQAASRPVGPAADWYSVGCILYEALTGLPPFRGAPLEVLIKKQSEEPPHPRVLNPSAPAELCDLALQLLRRDPEARIGGQTLLERLGPQPLPSGPTAESRLPDSHPFLGRREQITELERALADVGQGRSVTVLVEGTAGIGKSALIRHFTDGLGRDVVVLTGRCFERESVPYKAFDGVVDSLSRYLQALQRTECELLLPEDAALLAQVFPVLRRVEAIARLPQPSSRVVDRQEQRLRTFAALRTLLARLADSRLVVLVVEDLQWADLDSLALLTEVMRHPDPPSLLLLLSSRSSDVTLAPTALDGLAADVRRLRLGPLEAHETLTLVNSLLPDDAPIDAQTLCSESAGHPLFVVEMIRHVVDDGASGNIKLDEALAARLDRLDKPTRHLLEVIVIAGAPLEQDVAARAADLEYGEYLQRVNSLRIARLVRTGGKGREDTVEPYHTRISDVLLQHLTPEAVRHLHERLALGLEGSGRADAESLATHWRGAGQSERAATYAALAASQASTAFAFDRAARLYRLALELGPRSTAGWAELQADLGDVLANAGKAREAAQAYLTAAVGQSVGDSIELQRRAAEQLLRSGLIEDGLAILASVLSAMNLGDLTQPIGTLGLYWKVLRSRWRGIAFERRDESQLTRQQVAAIDVCWSVAVCLGMVEPTRGLRFQLRHLQLALETGEPVRVARALATEACYLGAMATPANVKRATQCIEEARRIATEAADPRTRAWAMMADGIVAYLSGDFRRARAECDRAQKLWRSGTSGAFWEIANSQIFSLWAAAQSGEIAELVRRVPQYMREAHDRGDLYSATNLRVGACNLYWLALDDPDGGRREVLHAMRRWQQKTFHMQHYYALVAEAQLDLYLGEGLRAYERLLERWSELERSPLMRITLVRVDAEHMRARVILATARRTANRKALLKKALASARTIEKIAPWARGHTRMVEAACAWLERKNQDVLPLLTKAADAYEAAGMMLYATAVRYRIGQHLGGNEGKMLIQTASVWAQQQSIKNFPKMVSMLAPGLFD